MATDISNRQTSNQDKLKDYMSFWAFVAVIIMAILLYTTFTLYAGRDSTEYPSAPVSQTMGSLESNKANEPAIVHP